MRFLQNMVAAVCAFFSPVWGFSGIYFGGHLGANWFKADHHFNVSGSDDNKSLSKYGVLAGIHGGYAYEFTGSKSTLGFEVGYHLMSGKPQIVLSQNATSVGTARIQQKNGVYLAATLGKLINPKVFVYTKAGVDYSRFDYKYTTSLLPGGSLSGQKSRFSPAAGMGFKYSITQSIVAGIDYMYSGFYKKITPFQDSVGGNDVRLSFKPTSHRLYLTVSYHFGS